ncbi:hypothetical protein N9D31_02100 [Oligoflexaceae bacterium]|nr:hypothetical protein [Oligoflexaceae bacterium]
MIDRIAEILTLSENDKEPMASYVKVELKSHFEKSELRNVVLTAARENTDLCKYPQWSNSSLVWHQSQSVDGIIFTGSLDEFYREPIPFGPTPVWRVIVEDSKTFHLAVHHALADGVSIMKIVMLLVEYLRCETETSKPTLQLTAREKSSSPKNMVVYICRVLFALIKRRLRELFFAPLLLGAKSSESGQSIFQHYRVIKAERFQKILTNIRSHSFPTTILDQLLVSINRSIEWHVDQNKKNHAANEQRISILLPFDRRGHQLTGGPLWNCVGTININTRPPDRRSKDTLSHAIRKQTERINQERIYSTSFAVTNYVIWMFKTGILSALERITPSFLKSQSWRSENTACLTFMPIFPGKSEVLAHIESIHGVAPVRMPMGISIGAGIFNKSLTLCLRASDACLSKEESRNILDRMIEDLESSW